MKTAVAMAAGKSNNDRPGSWSRGREVESPRVTDGAAGRHGRVGGAEVAAEPVAEAPAGAGEAAVYPSDAKEALRIHGAWLRAVAIARLRGLEGADDVMQDVAIAAVRNWETLRTTANAKAWLYRLTVRAALMYRRTLGRARRRIKEAAETYRAVHGLEEGTRKTGEGGTDPLGSLLEGERFGQLREAIARLPGKDVEMLLLKHVDDCSYQEIAERMGVTPGVVQMRLFRARQKLRDMLRPAMVRE